MQTTDETLATRFKLSEGTLQVDGAITNVTAHAGTTLAGGGLVRGFVNLQSGATFSPDGSTLFVNIQHDAITLAITGPWERRMA